MTSYIDDTEHLGDNPETDDWVPPLEVVDISPKGFHSPEMCNPVSVPIIQNGTSPVPSQLCQRSTRRRKARIYILGLGSGTLPVPAQPAVPASGTAIQNLNTFPVDVQINGGTISNVAVNGINMFSATGLYLVPAGGSIAVTYTVAPTWVWSNASGLAATSIVYNSRPDSLTGPNPQGGVITTFPFQIEWENQQPLYACAVGGGPVSAIVQDEQYAITDSETQ